MKLLILLFITQIYILNCQELVIDTRGYYSNDEIVIGNGNKLVHYSSKGNWSDNFNNYGRIKCKGSLLVNKDGKRSDKELVVCELEDVNGEFIWLVPKRSDSEWQAGVGNSTIIYTSSKYNNLIGKICVYAVTYYKDTFHTRTKCSV